MPRTYRRSFAETLMTIASRNAHALEHRALTASSLAKTYPENADAFRAIESVVLRQLFRIMTGTPQMERETGVGFGGVRSFAQFLRRIYVVIPEEEKAHES